MLPLRNPRENPKPRSGWPRLSKAWPYPAALAVVLLASTFLAQSHAIDLEYEEGSGEGRVRGNPKCWQDGYTFKDCCGPDAEQNCWDADFTEELCCTDVVIPPDQPLDIFEEGPADALERLAAYARDGPLFCPEDNDGFWRRVRYRSMVLNASQAYGMPGDIDGEEAADFVATLKTWLQDDDKWRKSKDQCPIGALNLIAMALPKLEKEAGFAMAQAASLMFRDFYTTLVEEKRWPPSHDWPILLDQTLYNMGLLGLRPRHSCHGTSLQFYMYDVPELAHMTNPVLVCSQKMSQCAASVHLHRWLMSGNCPTDDPSKADFFYVPAYEACYNETTCGFGFHQTNRCFREDFKPEKHLPYFERSRGVDHIFTFGCNLLPWFDSVMVDTRNSVLVTVESFQPETSNGNIMSWFNLWKDVMIPGYLPAWRVNAMLQFNQPVMQRNILVGFHGHSSRNPKVGHWYKRSPIAEVRDRIINYFWNKTRCSAGPAVYDYFRRMGRTRFCLVPAGLTAWTIHLYEAFFFGCIPVILSDHLVVPFQQEIDWPSLSIQVPTNISMEELHEKLAAFRVGRIKQMHRALAANRCWFDYSQGWNEQGRDVRSCSPYRAMLSALEARSRTRQLFPLSPFWSPPPTTDT